MNSLIPVEAITGKIYFVRGHKVLMDRDLAELYGVETGQLKRAVRRNIDRFPPDFMFELSKEEFENLRCQFGASSWGGMRYPPMAFTEQGVADFAERGGYPQKVLVDTEELLAWANERGLPVNGESRSQYASWLAKEIDHGRRKRQS